MIHPTSGEPDLRWFPRLAGKTIDHGPNDHNEEDEYSNDEGDVQVCQLSCPKK
eukprot:m.130131 g.130131  ORF g.130131 m.130131 type:complete len:53 (-) comp14594_c2_seq4:306-464(-)